MNPFTVLRQHVPPDDPVYDLLVAHSSLVAARARDLAIRYLARHPDAAIDVDFITEAAMLHDIGIRDCNAPKILCHGAEPYIRHGVIGREILEKDGLPRHALVCERHTGAGITRQEVLGQGLPIPDRDYLPVSLEEKIICVADKFFGKKPARVWIQKSPEAIRESLGKWGPDVVARWDRLYREVME